MREEALGIREVGACLRAVFEPADPEREPLVQSRSIKHALERLECEADELKEVALNDGPASNIREAIRQIVKER